MPRYSAIILATCCAVFPGHAIAQTETSEPEGGNRQLAASDASTAIGEIIVTAQRRSESLQRTPLAISVITGEALQNSGVTQVENLTKAVPALQVSRANGPYTLFYIRGVGNFIPNPLAEAAIAFNVDGVYIARPSSPHGSLYDLERVEVLKGPQGTLYGRNATGGAINVISRKPELDSTGAEFSLEVGNYSSRGAQGAINIPLGERAAFRGAFNIANHDGYLSDGRSDDQAMAGRVSIRFDPSDNLTTTTRLDYFHQGGTGVGGTVLPLDRIPGKWVGLHDQRSIDLFTNNTYGGFPVPFTPPIDGDFQDNVNWGISTSIDWESEAGTLTVIPAYRKSKLDYRSTQAGFFTREQTSQDQKSLEVRFASRNDGLIRWLAGGYVLDENISGHPDYDQDFFVVSQDLELRNKSYAAFGQATIAATDSFHVTGGIRYTRDERAMDAALYQAGQSSPRGGALRGPSPQFTVDRKNSWSKVNWKAGVEWHANTNLLVYGHVSTGYKAGGFYLAPVDNTYAPEEVTAYTAGWKSRFLGGRLLFNVEGFYFKYKDQQIGHLALLPDGNGGITLGFPTENIGRATNYGAEADIQLRPLQDTLLSLQAQWLRTRYDEFQYLVPDTSGFFFLPPFSVAPATGCASTALTGSGQYLIDCSGRPAVQAPELVLSLALKQDFRLPSGALFTLDARTRYESKRFTSESYLPQTHAGANTTSDVAITFHAPDDKWFLGGYVRNLEGKEVVASSFPFTYYPISNIVTGSLRPPRTYGVRFGMNF